MQCNKITIGEHAFRRMFEREISPEDVLNSIRGGEVIKEYPDDKPYPSYLILSFVKNKPVHVVVAKNDMRNICFVITVYEPDPNTWSKDFKIKLYE